MREIVLDTETTGIDPQAGHRLIEIGCVELDNLMPTGRRFHEYFNPERPVEAGAVEVHGLTDDFLADKPLIGAKIEEFLAFIGDAPLVIHNASFDIGFLNAELARLNLSPLPMSRAIDTLALARERYPGAAASLDALCRRHGIDASARTYHGALLDAELLSEVYLELKGGRQPTFGLDDQATGAGGTIDGSAAAARRASLPIRQPRPHAPTDDELAQHRALLDQLERPIWLN